MSWYGAAKDSATEAGPEHANKSGRPAASPLGAAQDQSLASAGNEAFAAMLQSGRFPAPLLSPLALAGNAAVARLMEATRVHRAALAVQDAGPLSPEIATAIDAVRGGGAPLPDGIRTEMEEHFGVDLSPVRLHTGPRADTLNRAVNARAFTSGTDVFFSTGTYDPTSTSGRELLAHELTHVAQQAGGSAGPVGRVSHPDDAAEVEAREVAQRVMRSEPGPAPQRESGSVAIVRRSTTGPSAPLRPDRAAGIGHLGQREPGEGANQAGTAVQRAGGDRAAAPADRQAAAPLALAGSVGRKGDNQPGDVQAVQARLEQLGFLRAADRAAETPQALSSSPDAPAAAGRVADTRIPLTIRAIGAFQKERAYQHSDGRINPGGKTLAALNADQPTLDSGVERVAGSITGVFEGGRPDTLNTYDRGIVSYGKHQATLAAGSLYLILKRFCDTSTSDASRKLATYLARVEHKDGSLQHDKGFLQLLKDAAYEPAMLAAQEQEFREQYWDPSQKRADKLKITTALGRAFFYDSQIQGGGGGLNRLIEGAKRKLGGVPGEIVGGQEITEQKFVLAMIDTKAERLQQQAAKQLASAAKLEERAAAIETQAVTMQAAGDTDAATRARKQAAALRVQAKRDEKNGQALITSATKSRIPAWRALAEAGDWQLAGGPGGFLTIKNTPIVGTGGSGASSGTAGAAEVRPTTTGAVDVRRPDGESTSAPGATPAAGALLAALAGAAGASVGALRQTADALGMGGSLPSFNRAGIEDDLTDLVFALRHPELEGRSIRKDEKGHAREWVSIRDEIIRPILGPVDAGKATTQDGAADDTTGVAGPSVVEEIDE